MAADQSEVRPFTPALVAGLAAGQRHREEVSLPSGVEGELLRFANDTTIVLTKVGSSMAFVPALVCRDRAQTGSKRPPELPQERWQRVELESTEFNTRYVLMSLAGQDEGLIRELFSPSLITWLEGEPPPGFSVELNEGFLTVALPGHLEGEERDRLLVLAGEISRRLDAEIAEEGDESLDVFSEEAEYEDIERGLRDVGYERPPESVDDAVQEARATTGWKPTTIITAIQWGAVALALTVPIAYLIEPIAAVLTAVIVFPLFAYVGWLISKGKYRWGTASVPRVALEAWVRGYADSRGLELEDRWRFHATHRSLPVPGLADHVLAGELPQTKGLVGRLLFMADAAELRALGQEIAYTSARPLCSNALFVEASPPLPADAGAGIELPEGYHVEIDGSHVLVWRPVHGNMARTSAGTDRFCERASAVVRQIV